MNGAGIEKILTIKASVRPSANICCTRAGVKFTKFQKFCTIYTLINKNKSKSLQPIIFFKIARADDCTRVCVQNGFFQKHCTRKPYPRAHAFCTRRGGTMIKAFQNLKSQSYREVSCFNVATVFDVRQVIAWLINPPPQHPHIPTNTASAKFPS